MFTIITMYSDSRPIHAYQVENLESALYLARTTAQYDEVVQSTVFSPNNRDANGLGSMVHRATFGHDV